MAAVEQGIPGITLVFLLVPGHYLACLLITVMLNTRQHTQGQGACEPPSSNIKIRRLRETLCNINIRIYNLFNFLPPV
jgi:hypothetical protein